MINRPKLGSQSELLVQEENMYMCSWMNWQPKEADVGGVWSPSHAVLTKFVVYMTLYLCYRV